MPQLGATPTYIYSDAITHRDLTPIRRPKTEIVPSVGRTGRIRRIRRAEGAKNYQKRVSVLARDPRVVSGEWVSGEWWMASGWVVNGEQQVVSGEVNSEW